MITVRHPDPECNARQARYSRQARYLETCPPEQRRTHELMSGYGNATYRYHNEARQFEPTAQDWVEWLEGLAEPMRTASRGMGFDTCKTILSFTRHVMEKNDVGMEQYVRRLMGEADHAEYRAMLGGGGL